MCPSLFIIFFSLLFSPFLFLKNFERRNACDERDVVEDDEKRERESVRVCVCGGGGLEVVVVVVGRLWRLVCLFFRVVFRVNTLFSFDDESAFDEGNKERRRRPR